MCLAVTAAGPTHGQNTEVDLGKTMDGAPKGGKIIISISRFSPTKESEEKEFGSKKLTDILKNDLFISGMFSQREGPPAGEKNDLNFSELISKGIEYAAIASYTVKNKELILTGALYNVRGIFKVFKKRYNGNKEVHRALVHQFAEDILRYTTGSRGITSSRITFISDRSGHKEIYAVDYDGYNIRQLTREKSIVLLPRWSPDNEKIIYTSYKLRRPGLYVLDTKTGNSKRLFPSTYTNMGGRWSPDGASVVLTMTRSGNSDIYIYNEKKNELKKLTRSWAIETSASWLPNGREILFTSDRSGKPQIYIIDAEGTNLRRLTYEGRYNDSGVCYGDRIAYVSLEENKFNIYTMRFDGSGRKRLTYNGGSNENPSWSPDGNYIVFTSDKGEKKGVYIMRADGEYEKLLFYLRGNSEDPSWSR